MRRPIEARFRESVRCSPGGATTSVWSPRGCPGTELVALNDGGAELKLSDGSLVRVPAHNVRYVWFSAPEVPKPAPAPAPEPTPASKRRARRRAKKTDG